LDRRVLKSALDFTGVNAADLSTIAAKLIEAAMVQQDPGHTITVVPSGVIGERSYPANGDYVGNLLRDLVKTGIDISVAGKEFRISSSRSCGVVGSLVDEEFITGLKVVEDGLALCTESVVAGDGTIVGTAGGIDPYYGLVTCKDTQTAIKDQASADAAAKSHIAVAFPAPLFIQTEDDAVLSSDANIDFVSLVPGFCVNVFSTLTCRPVTGTFTIHKLRVRDTAEQGERVGLTLAPIGIDPSDEL
jgi:hypothetical protein